ncbi:MAG TPA: thymidine phosphorylase [Planctomycetaceae bacterium]|nr:thymidine phosphorylase [Planctomycetaceae bacterium]
MLAKQIIEKKRDGGELTSEEIQFMVMGATNGQIKDYQVSAWLMAILCRGMTEAEIACLTEVMLRSGNRLQRCSDRPRVDKHSTGGLGDKTSLILAPLLACFDLDVPMLSGRGLGITGGTLDKLESYEGYRCDLQTEEINRQLQEIGCVITGTTKDITPADRYLYALRDVTGTVPSVALITGSIMSKKLAESLDALVLDVKWGSGAFMRSIQQAQELESSLIRTGRRMGVVTTSLLTDMNHPLGRMVGNACEVNESLDVLRGGGPDDVRELTLALAAELLVSTGRATSQQQALPLLQKALEDGRTLTRYQSMIEAQGGKFREYLPLARSHTLEASQSGWLATIEGSTLGHAIVAMGGGRNQQSDPVDKRVGFEFLVRVGDPIEVGQPLMRVFYDGSQVQTETLMSQAQSALSIVDTPTSPLKLIANH